MGFLAFSRSFESEADYLGLQHVQGGYDPNACSVLYNCRREKSGHAGEGVFYASANAGPDHEITRRDRPHSSIAPAAHRDNSEFGDVKARLASLENRRKVVDDKGGNKPSLRRASTTDKSTDKNGTREATMIDYSSPP
jgi:hypothetical protein